MEDQERELLLISKGDELAFNSFMGESSPLVIIDGVESSLDYVNTNDVESISVLKDAAAASIYGSKAAAGVILVTTKRGNDSGKIDLKYNAEFGWEIPTMQPSMISVMNILQLISIRYNSLGVKPMILRNMKTKAIS